MIELQPGLDRVFFASMAKVDEKSLLQTLNALAVRKDFVSMNGFLDFFERECESSNMSEFDLLEKRQGITILEPSSATSIECDQREDRATLARTLVRPLHENFAEPHVPLDDVAIAYVKRMVGVLGMLPEKERKNTLELAMFEACNQTRDARVFEIMVDAGTDITACIRTRAIDPSNRVNRKGDFMINDEAIHQSNFAAALVLARRMPEADCTTHSIEMSVMDMNQKKKQSLRGFRENATADTMIRALAQFGRNNDDLEALLALLGENAKNDPRMIGNMEAFHTGLLAGYLQELGKTSPELWNLRSLEIAAGPNGLRHDGPIAQWIQDQVDEGIAADDMASCLAHHAIQAHCRPVLVLCAPVLAEYAQKPEQAHNEEIGYLWAIYPPMRQNAQVATPPADPVRFAETLDALRSSGFSPTAETKSSRIDKGTPLHICAQLGDVDDMLVKMPALLAIGCDPKILDSNDRAPAELVTDPGAKARWISIEASFRARNAAMTVLDDLENDSISVPKTLHP